MLTLEFHITFTCHSFQFTSIHTLHLSFKNIKPFLVHYLYKNRWEFGLCLTRSLSLTCSCISSQKKIPGVVLYHTPHLPLSPPTATPTRQSQQSSRVSHNQEWVRRLGSEPGSSHLHSSVSHLPGTYTVISAGFSCIHEHMTGSQPTTHWWSLGSSGHCGIHHQLWHENLAFWKSTTPSQNQRGLEITLAHLRPSHSWYPCSLDMWELMLPLPSPQFPQL